MAGYPYTAAARRLGVKNVDFECLDKFVDALIEKGKYRIEAPLDKQCALNRFRTAAVCSVYLARKYAHDEGVNRERNRKALRERKIVRSTLYKLRAAKIASPSLDFLSERRRQLIGVAVAYPSPNYRGKNLFRFALVVNLAVFWEERLIGQRPPISETGVFVGLVDAVFAAIEVSVRDAGRLVKSILGQTTLSI